MRKIIKSCLCFAVLISLMVISVSCGRNVSNVTDSAKENKEVTLKWMIFGEKSKSSDSVIAEFNQELEKYLPGVAVEFEIVPLSDYKDKWEMKMATNEELV